jgi:hypothetical protein
MPDRSLNHGLVTRRLVVLLVLLAELCVAPRAEARVAQDPPPDPTSVPDPGAGLPGEPTPVPPTGDPGVPVPPASGGDPEATTTTVAVLGPTEASQELSESEKANRRVQLVVISLLVLAVVVAGATFVFWRRTSPSRVASSEGNAVVSRRRKP